MEAGEAAAAQPSRASSKIPCRYGLGCTHMADPVHHQRFWHPTLPEQRATNTEGGFVCNECGLVFTDVHELQLHMRRKTAWSNQSLIGCRVSCLLDNREWQEGSVIQYHKSGKHCVEFKATCQKRWLHMLRTAFYIIERPSVQQETKEAEPSDVSDGLAPIEQWTYAEEVSVDFVIAQSRLHRSFGSKIQETGHKTSGHLCVTEEDRSMARDAKGSLLYGELLPRGVNKALSPKHLRATHARVVFDLGMGTGKVAMQSFLQFPNLQRAFGVELSLARFKIAEKACFNLLRLHPDLYTLVSHTEGKFLQLRSVQGNGMLQLQWGNMLHVTDLHEADIVFLETDVSQDVYHSLCLLLLQMKDGGRILSYLDIRKIWDVGPFPFHQLEVNRSLADRFPTSWSVHRGHHFYIWVKVHNQGTARTTGSLAESPQAQVLTPHRGASSDAGASSAMSSALSSQEPTAQSYWLFPPLSSTLKRWRPVSGEADASPAAAQGCKSTSPPSPTASSHGVVKRAQVGIDPTASTEITVRQKQPPSTPDDAHLQQRPRQRQLHPASSAPSSPTGKNHCVVM